MCNNYPPIEPTLTEIRQRQREEAASRPEPWPPLFDVEEELLVTHSSEEIHQWIAEDVSELTQRNKR